MSRRGWCRRCPGSPRFPELNVRTYVTVGDKPGVFFFSLDAGNPLAVGAGAHAAQPALLLGRDDRRRPRRRGSLREPAPVGAGRGVRRAAIAGSAIGIPRRAARSSTSSPSATASTPWIARIGPTGWRFTIRRGRSNRPRRRSRRTRWPTPPASACRRWRRCSISRSGRTRSAGRRSGCRRSSACPASSASGSGVRASGGWSSDIR